MAKNRKDKDKVMKRVARWKRNQAKVHGERNSGDAAERCSLIFPIEGTV